MDIVKSVIRDLKRYDETFPVELDSALVDDLQFSSMDMMNLIIEMEKRFEITFGDEDLDLEHFETPRRILLTLDRVCVQR